MRTRVMKSTTRRLATKRRNRKKLTGLIKVTDDGQWVRQRNAAGAEEMGTRTGAGSKQMARPRDVLADRPGNGQIQAGDRCGRRADGGRADRPDIGSKSRCLPQKFPRRVGDYPAMEFVKSESYTI
jgi:hypothetical protein